MYDHLIAGIGAVICTSMLLAALLCIHKGWWQ